MPSSRHSPDFTARVLAVVRRIPYGRVATYGEVAVRAGRPGAARAVGNIMRTCSRPDVPCHRVIAAGGRLGGYGGSEVLKRQLLLSEGVIVHGNRVKSGQDRLDRTAGGPSGRAGPGPSTGSGRGNAGKGLSRLRKRR
jgi:methylated-DNA-[protein]-cysteine S-methyltransferase